MKAVPRSCLHSEAYRLLLPQNEARIIIFDVETTGFDPRYNEMIEIGAIEFRGAQEIKRFHEYACPAKQISKSVSEVHGLTQKSLKGQQNSLQLTGNFVEWIGDISDVFMIGHNVKFDLSFLEASLKVYNRIERKNLTIPEKVFCTFTFIKNAFNRDASLDQACKIFEIKDIKQRIKHGAMIDAELTSKLYFCMKD